MGDCVCIIILHIVQYYTGKYDITNLSPPDLCAVAPEISLFGDETVLIIYILYNRHGQEGITILFYRQAIDAGTASSRG